MDKWEPLIDRMIRESMDRGEFDNLPGAGQPIDLAENSYEPPELRNVHRLLRNAGFAPAWIEERKDIDADLEAARISLARNRRILECAGHATSSTRAGAMGQSCRELSHQSCRA